MIEAEFQDFFYTSADNLRLHARIYGESRAGALPVICLAGLTRNARDFHRLALFLSRDAATRRQVIAFDYRGRGESEYDTNWQNYTIGTELADILAGLDQLGIRRGLFIGTSRGGLITQVLAKIKPGLIVGAVLNDIGPVVEPQGLNIIRRYLATPEAAPSITDAVEHQKKVHGRAFPALSDDDWTAMVDAVFREENGLAVADFDADLVKTLTSADPDQPLPQLWAEFDALAKRPVLAIRGANSMLLSAETLAEMAARSKLVETITVPGQGHAPFLETGELPERIASFMDRAEKYAA